ncbi:CBS domain-containing protein [Tissierella praeacuta]|uniref:CBS domain-containing protein n=1 Tax=Tissierella praeacuta TaxID=43131 RepID=UPI003519AAF3
MKVREIMKSPVISVKPSDTISRVLEIMKNENVNGTPIVNEGNHLMGIIVKADIYRFLMEPGHYESCPVEWVMIKKVIKAHVEEDILEVANRLRNHDIIALPVLDNDVVVGIVSIEDFIDYYIRNSK